MDKHSETLLFKFQIYHFMAFVTWKIIRDTNDHITFFAFATYVAPHSQDTVLGGLLQIPIVYSFNKRYKEISIIFDI